VGGGARQDHAPPARGAGAAAGRRAAAAAGGRGHGAPRRAGGAEGRRGEGRRLPPRLRDVGVRRRAMLPLDRRLPPFRSPQGQLKISTS
jgi:hypothetical protein